MENNNNYTTFALPNSIEAQLCYPYHDPPLPPFSALVNRHQPGGLNIQILNNSVEQDHNSHHVTIVFGSLNVENQRPLPIIVTENDNGQDEHITGYEEDDIEGGGGGGGVTDDDPNILGISQQQTTRLNTPNVAPYLLSIVLSLLVFLFFNLKQGNHTDLHIANPFVLLSVVGSGIAYVSFSILSWVYDHSDNKMLKGIYYIGCNLAFISLLLMLFTST